MWNENKELNLNNHIHIEYWASYRYHLLWSFFDKDSVGLKNIANFFLKNSHEEREHAHKFMEYQNLRGGNVELLGIDINLVDISFDFLKNTDSTGCYHVKTCFEKALEMEQSVYEALLTLHKNAEDDPQFTDFIESEFLDEQVKAINELKKYISQLKLLDKNGIWQFNKFFDDKN